MPRSSQYSHSRRLAMQVVMCLLLAASLGAAALVSRWKKPAAPKVEQWVRTERPRVPLLAGWHVRIRQMQQDGWQINELLAEEPADSRLLGRKLSIRQQPVEKDLTAEDYLDRQDELDHLTSVRTFEPVRVGPLPGVSRDAVRASDEEEPIYAFGACTIIPDGWAISVRLWVPGIPTPADKALFQQVLGSIRLVNGTAE